LSQQISEPTRFTIPDELLGSTPRQVSISGNDASFIVWMVLLFVCGGGSVIGWWSYSGVQQTHHRAALRSSGQLVMGAVSDVLAGRGDSYVEYTFSADGATYAGKAQMPNTRLILHKGAPLSIRYLPSDPGINHPAEWEWSPTMGLAPILFFVAYLGITIWMLAYLRRERALARRGKPTEGVVTSCISKGRFYQVEYEFRTDEGERLTGASDFADSCDTGQTICILYMPRNPRRNHAYPLTDYKVSG
jgi:hypothetical protein